MSVAVAQWGEVQVELIRQHDAVPTIYTTFAAGAGSGLQHLGVMTDSVPEHLERLSAAGVTPVQSGSTANGIRFAYLDTDALPGSHPGGMIELIERGPAIDAFFAMVRAASLDWNGDRPLRRLG
jgi:hypothetical protein